MIQHKAYIPERIWQRNIYAVNSIVEEKYWESWLALHAKDFIFKEKGSEVPKIINLFPEEHSLGV